MLNINTVFVDSPGSVMRQYLVLNIYTVFVDSPGSVMRQYLVLNINTVIVDSPGSALKRHCFLLSIIQTYIKTIHAITSSHLPH